MSVRIPAALLAAFTLGAASPPGGIQVLVEDVRSAIGTIHVELCTQDTFTKACAVSARAPARSGATAVLLPTVPAGTYALQGYQDLNGNGRLDMNLFGIPKEPVFFSRLAKLPFHRPRFAESNFEHGAADQRMTVYLRSYF